MCFPLSRFSQLLVHSVPTFELPISFRCRFQLRAKGRVFGFGWIPQLQLLDKFASAFIFPLVQVVSLLFA
ncbi:unnamed protein product [Malus baccata var. baccata]